MKPSKKINLMGKGWTQQEIQYAEKKIEAANQHDVFFSKIVFASAIVVIIFANLLVSLIFIPFLVVLNEWFLYAIIAILAATVGFLYNFLITDIGHLDTKHHLLAAIVIPLLAIINTVAVVLVSNKLIVETNIQNPLHNPWTTSIIFVVAFILPYLIAQLRLHLQQKAVLI